MSAIDRTRCTLSSSRERPCSEGILSACNISRLEMIWRLFFTRWWISLSSVSFSRSDCVSEASMWWRSVRSRTAMMAACVEDFGVAATLISAENSWPSWPRAARWNSCVGASSPAGASRAARTRAAPASSSPSS